MANNVNVNRNVVDPYYRYKMPKLQAKVEGKGNGIKTVIANMVEIAKALERPPMYPTKYFGCELGAQTNFDTKNDRYIVNGDHDATKLQNLLDGFIRKFVLCANCDNPETTYSIKRNTIYAKCKACGHSYIIDPKHKLSTFIVKNPPPSSDEDKDSSKKENTSPTEDKASDSFEFEDTKVQPVVDDDDWCPVEEEQETVTAAIGKLIIDKDLDKSLEERLDILYNFIVKAKENGTICDGKLIANEAERLDLKIKAPLLLADVIFDTDILKQISQYRILLLGFTHNDKKAQRYLLGGIEQVIHKYKDALLPKAAHILKCLYDNDVCEEETILAWGNKPSSKYVKKDFAKEIISKCEPVLNWLKEAEEESSEEESDGEIEFDDRARQTGTITVEPKTNGHSKAAPVPTIIRTEDDEELDIDDI
uniref:Eukaryotic translation initiation factor 5 n=1 Tax=Parastrongyloides trichosuri TaxID=131310 RepID=A0A0N4Z3H6_PARTI